MESEVLGKNILHFPRLLEHPELFISHAEECSLKAQTNWGQWMSQGDDVPHNYGELWILKRDQNQSDPATEKLLDYYDSAVLSSLLEFLSYLGVEEAKKTETLDLVANSRPNSMALKRYFEGEELGPHPDTDPNHAPEILPLTVSMYYNDNYEGGLFGFRDGAYIKPTPGSVVVFPSKYFHESTQVTGGIKYVSNEVVTLDAKYLGVVID